MAECDVNYSPETASAAARAFLSRRYLTKVGLYLVFSWVACTVMLIYWSDFRGADWFVGFLATLIGLNLIIHVSAFWTLPRAMAKTVAALPSPRVGHITTSNDEVRIALGGNVAVLPWSRFKYIWPQDRFVLLGLSMFRLLHIPTDAMTSEVRADFMSRASPTIWA